tara:strand:+ start:3841 stop:5823 length:1983 start_codon:yes stop_codon:yes gene_type:complete
MEEGCINDIKTNNIECRKLLIKDDTLDILSIDTGNIVITGTITGATSITSTAFVGDLTGNVTGNTSGTSATVTGAAQTEITSVGTLSALTVSGDLIVDTNTLKIDSTNNRVGIGITSPGSQLHTHVPSSASCYHRFTNSTTGSTGDNGCVIGLAADEKFRIHQFNDDDICFYTNNIHRMTILGSGNVGIGINNPVSLLHIYENSGNTSGSCGLTIENDGTGDAICQFLITGATRWVTGVDNSDSNKFKISSDVYLNTNARLTIDTSGNVGIGTTNPQSRIHIKQSSNASTDYNSTAYGDGLRIENTQSDFWVISVDGDSTNSELVFKIKDAYGGGFLNGSNFYSNLDFTGQHRSILNKNINDTSIGLIVSSSGNFINLDNSLNANINESLPICILTNIDNDKKVFGVISDKEDNNINRTYNTGNWGSFYEKHNKNEQRMFINSLGEGAIWICNKNGALENGDYISSSSVLGYGMLQNTNKLLNSTVAKITCNCDFSLTKIVKQKLKVITTTETYEENITQDIQKTNTETKIKFDETLQKYVEEQIITTTTEKEQLYDTINLYDSSGNLLTDSGGNTRTRQIERKQTLTKTLTDIDYDANGDVQYDDDLDDNGAQQMIFPLETRYLQADATQITETEYNTKLEAGEPVYIACFVGCTYHCG